ncbi:MAG: hypothetical protein U0L51_02825 [Olegusella sp.]|nr:hypothetical protein [Olegusella sp.]
MTGKVFPESANIYEDEAKVLFDYYRRAAERIISEEDTLQDQINYMQESLDQNTKKAEEANSKAKKMLIAAIVAAVAGVLLGFVAIPLILVGLALGGYFFYARTKAQKEEADATRGAQECSSNISALMAQKGNIRRDYRVKKIGVAYVPVAERVPAGDKSMVVDYTGTQPETNFSLTVLNQPDELREAIGDLGKSMDEMPLVESNDEAESIDTSDYSTSMQDVTLHDYMGAMDRQVRNVGYLIDDNREVSVSLPVVIPNSDRDRFLEEYSTDTPGDLPVVPIFDSEAIRRRTEDFSRLGELSRQAAADGSGNVDFFAQVMQELAQSVDMLSKSKTESVSKLVGYASQTFASVLKASYDQYSPTLEAEEIERIRTATFDYGDEVDGYQPFALRESSRVRYDLVSDVWVADNGSRTRMPFGMHQVDSEVLMPVIENLMQENAAERRSIYNEIQDQKTDYLNQWHRETDDFFGRNRAEANGLIQKMNETYAQYSESYTNYQQQAATLRTMKNSGKLEDAEVAEADNQDEIIAGFQVQANQCRSRQEEFTSFMDRIQEDINESAERFGHVEYYEASLRDSQARDIARAAADVQSLDPRRRDLVAVSPYLAHNGEVPPAPDVNDQLDEDFTLNLTEIAKSEVSALTDEPDGVNREASK